MATGVPSAEVSTELALPCSELGTSGRYVKNSVKMSSSIFVKYRALTEKNQILSKGPAISQTRVRHQQRVDSRDARFRKLGHEHPSAGRGESGAVRCGAGVRDDAALVAVRFERAVRRVLKGAGLGRARDSASLNSKIGQSGDWVYI